LSLAHVGLPRLRAVLPSPCLLFFHSMHCFIDSTKTFGISTEDGKRIIYRLGGLLLSEHEKLFGSYWRQVFGPPSSLMHLLGKGHCSDLKLF
jgi:hypothetical protein